jgi:hypothetical protein
VAINRPISWRTMENDDTPTTRDETSKHITPCFSINNQGWTGDGDVCDQIHVLQSFSEDAQWFIFRCWETFWLDASLNSAALSENAESTAQNAEHLQTLPF